MGRQDSTGKQETAGKPHRAFDRRQFLTRTGAVAAVFTVIPRHVLGWQDTPAANEKINIAGIGVGGQGAGDIRAVGGENIVALCDVDRRNANGSFERFPEAKQYCDYRVMLAEMEDDIDAVVVATPDHSHAKACLEVLKRCKHLYCEKPLAHSVYEVRTVMQAAHDAKVVTQLGNQGHSSGSIRTFCEWIWDGAIGNVQEVHASCDAFPNVYCQIRNLSKREEQHEVPAELNWDLWQGPAPPRLYNPMYLPFNWRGWTTYGTGCIGDWICHVVDPSFWALDLGAPTTIHAEVQGYDPKEHADVYPEGVAITFEFPAKGDRGPVKVIWYDGKMKPPRPAELEEDRNPPGTGAIVIGDEGTITHGSHGAGGVRLIPESKMRAYKQPEPSIPRVPGHHADWLQAIREGRQAGSNFDYGGPLTELGVLGMIAVRMAGTRLEWNSESMRFTNCDAANEYVKPSFREGWEI